MRQCRKNTQTVWFAHPEYHGYITDAGGFSTMDESVSIGEPKQIRMTVSPGAGEWVTSEFGPHAEYDAVLTKTGKCDIREGDYIWLGIDTSAEPNYTVVSVHSSLSENAIGIVRIPTNDDNY